MTDQTMNNDSVVDWQSPIASEIKEAPYSFDFFQAIRRIEALASDMPRVGHARRADQEAIRVLQSAAMDFAPATIDRVESAEDGRALVSQRFFGLLGPHGPMPLHVTEQVRESSNHRHDKSHESFLNLFHHRMATLFYRAWSSSRGAIQRDRPEEDRFAAYVGSLSGATSGNDSGQLYFSGRFASLHRNAEGLKEVVAGAVHSEVEVETFLLRQLRLQPEDRTLLSNEASSLGRGGVLGKSAVLGRTVADRRSLIGLVLGPLPLSVFSNLLPGGKLHQTLRNLVRQYVGAGIDCRVKLLLDRRSVPKTRLGKYGSLGRSSWLLSKRPDSNVGDSQFLV